MEWRKWTKAAVKWAAGNAIYNWIVGGGAWGAAKVIGGIAIAFVLALLGYLGDKPPWMLAVLSLIGFGVFVWIVNGIILALQRWGKMPTPSTPIDAAPEPPVAGPEPHVPNKSYNADLTYEVVGQGRYRYLISGLREDVGNGWDRGARLEVELPSEQVVSVAGWMELNTPEMRRDARRGGGVRAESEGPYVIRWWSIPAQGYDPELIVEETVDLPPTGPLEAWTATNLKRGDEILFRLEPDSPSRGPLRGFKCEIFGPTPGAPFVADDNSWEKVFYGSPSPKERGEFVFPRDFADAPRIRDLHDGDYTVYWTAWDDDVGADDRLQLDVARDRFRVDRVSGIETSGTDEIGIPGWDSRVVGVVRNERDSRLFTLNFILLTPEALPSDGALTAELTLPDLKEMVPAEARWEDFHTEDVGAPHYSLFFPGPAFGMKTSDLIDNGHYVLRWRQQYGISWRYVTEPHRFEIRNGELVTDQQGVS